MGNSHTREYIISSPSLLRGPCRWNQAIRYSSVPCWIPCFNRTWPQDIWFWSSDFFDFMFGSSLTSIFRLQTPYSSLWLDVHWKRKHCPFHWAG